MLVDYEYYLGYYCLFPLLACCGCFCLLMFAAFQTMKRIHARDLSFKSIFETIFLALVTIVIFIQSGIILLCKGGIYLLVEKEEDAVTISGSMEEIETADYSYRQARMYDFIINNTACTAIYVPTENSPAKNPFRVGDYVEVLYLPRSGYILSIEEIDSP